MQVRVKPAGQTVVIERRIANTTAPLHIETKLVNSATVIDCTPEERRIRIWVASLPPWISHNVSTQTEPLCNFVEITFTRFGLVAIEHDATEGLCHGYEIEVVLSSSSSSTLNCGYDKHAVQREGDIMIPSDKNKTESCNISSNADCRVSARTAPAAARAMQCCKDFIQEWSAGHSNGYCKTLKNNGCYARCWRFDRECERGMCAAGGSTKRIPWTTLTRANVDEVVVSLSPTASNLQQALLGYYETPHPAPVTAGVCSNIESSRGLVGCKTTTSQTVRLLIFVIAFALLVIVWGSVLWFRV